jgi:hypothetical protein
LPLIPANAPKKGEKWDNIMNDFTDLIMPGVYLNDKNNLFINFNI